MTLPDGVSTTRRACVYDGVSGDSWFEVAVNYAEDHAVPAATRLHCRSDRGSTGWRFLQWLYQKAGVEGSLEGDESHMEWDATRRAITRSGLETALMETTAAYSAREGPWHGAAFFRS